MLLGDWRLQSRSRASCLQALGGLSLDGGLERCAAFHYLFIFLSLSFHFLGICGLRPGALGLGVSVERPVA